MFNSKQKHRLKIYKAKMAQVGNVVYLKKQNQVVKINNIDDVFIEKDHLYFRALGQVSIFLETGNFWKYFELKITSSKIDLEKFKKLALNDIKNNVFDYKNKRYFKFYFNLLTRVLNVKLLKHKISIKQNKLKLPFVVFYKNKGVKKCIKINC